MTVIRVMRVKNMTHVIQLAKAILIGTIGFKLIPLAIKVTSALGGGLGGF